MNYTEQNYAEISVCPKKMQNMPESSSAYFIENAEDTAKRAEAVDEMMELVWTLVERNLTSRQKDIFHLCYQGQHTQQEIAMMLGISQATVNHHLIGKMKRGKPVGGAIQKIRKSIRRALKDGGNDSAQNRLFTALNRMLDQHATRRAMTSHFQTLLLIAGRHP
jgi:predicted transcriptional regulator